MQLSCLPVSFFLDIIENRMTIVQWAQMGVEIGLDAIDLSILFFPELTIAAAEEIRQQVTKAGSKICMVTSYPDFTHPDPAQRELELIKECRVVELAAGAGAEMVRVTAGQAHPETNRADGIRWASTGLAKLAEATCSSGIKLVYENHAQPGAWKYTDFSQPPDIFLDILINIQGYGIGVNFDTGNATCFAEDPRLLLSQVIDQVSSIHASDTSERGRLVHTLLGTGLTPFLDLFAQLKSSKWDGWICMEEASYQGRFGVETAAKFIRDTWDKA